MKAAELKTFLATAVSYRKHSCEDGGHGRGRPPNWIKYQDATDMAALVEHAKAAHGYVIGETRPWGRLNVRSQAHILPICPCFCIGKSEEEDKRMHSELYQLPTASSRSCSGAPLAARGGARRCTSSPQLPAAHPPALNGITHALRSMVQLAGSCTNPFTHSCSFLHSHSGGGKVAKKDEEEDKPTRSE